MRQAFNQGHAACMKTTHLSHLLRIWDHTCFIKYCGIDISLSRSTTLQTWHIARCCNCWKPLIYTCKKLIVQKIFVIFNLAIFLLTKIIQHMVYPIQHHKPRTMSRLMMVFVAYDSPSTQWVWPGSPKYNDLVHTGALYQHKNRFRNFSARLAVFKYTGTW